MKKDIERLRRRLSFESLESRRVLASFIVVNTNDSGPGSMRDAILRSNQNPGLDSIIFAIADATKSIKVTATPEHCRSSPPRCDDSTRIRRDTPGRIARFPSSKPGKRAIDPSGKLHRQRSCNPFFSWRWHSHHRSGQQHHREQLHRHRLGRYAPQSQWWLGGSNPGVSKQSNRWTTAR